MTGDNDKYDECGHPTSGFPWGWMIVGWSVLGLFVEIGILIFR
jgi:hypothetical protein